MEPEVKSEEVKTEPTVVKHRFLELEPMNIIDLVIVVLCGITLIKAIDNGNSEAVFTIVGGFMGYLGGGARSLVRSRATPNTPEK